MIKLIPKFLKAMAPFIMGIVIGGVLIYTISIGKINLQSVLSWISTITATFLIISIIGWISYKAFLTKLKSQSAPSFINLFKKVEEAPEKIKDADFRNKHMWPMLPGVIKTVMAWFAFSGSIAMALAFVTNMTLFATLAVQSLQVDRLTEQNDLLNTQTIALEKQTRALLIQHTNTLNATLLKFRKSEEEVDRMLNLITKLKEVEIKSPFTKQKLKIKKYMVEACSLTKNTSKCKNAEFNKVIGNAGNPFFNNLKMTITYLKEKNKKFNHKDIGNIAFMIKRIRYNGDVCRFDPGKIRLIIEKVEILRELEQSAYTTVNGFVKQNPDRYKTGIKDFRKSADNFLQLVRNNELADSSYTINEFNTDLSKEYQALDKLLNEFKNSCTEERKKIEKVLSW